MEIPVSVEEITRTRFRVVAHAASAKDFVVTAVHSTKECAVPAVSSTPRPLVSVSAKPLLASALSTLGPMPVLFQAGGGSPGRKCRILCYGDSLTAGFCDMGRKYEPYGRALAQALSSARGGALCEVLVCGHSGHTVEQMVSNFDSSAVTDIGGMVGKGLRRILKDDAQLPDLVLLMAGTNDIGHDRRPQDVLADLRTLHAVCHSFGIASVAIAPPDAPKAPRGTPFFVGRKNLTALMARWSSTAQGVASFIDPDEIIPASNMSAFGIWDPDGLHLSPSGSQFLGKHLARRVLPLLPASPSRVTRQLHGAQACAGCANM